MSMQVMFSSSAVFLFMLLLMCCGSGGVVCAGEVKPGSQSNSVELFKKGETKVSESATVGTSFRAHSLIDVNGLLVAFAEANSSSGLGKFNIEIWSKSLKYEKDKMPSEIIKPEGGGQQMAQAVALKKAGEGHYTTLFGPSAVVKDNKIYILVSNYTRPEANVADRRKSSGGLTDIELVVGTLGSTGDNQGTITWQDPTSLKDTLKTALGDNSWKGVYAPRGKGILMGGSTIVFPVGARKSVAENKVKHGCTVIYSDDGVSWKFPSNKVIAEGCFRSTLFEQGGKLFMVTASLESRTRNVYVSTDNGKTWTEYTEADSNLLLDFLKRANVGDTSDVIPATISDRNVTLLTQRRFILSGGGSESRDQVHLFMTDNKRITSMGPVSLDKGISSVCKLLLTKENDGLFALCDKGPRGSPESAVLLSLSEQLGRISSVLQGWESTDRRVSSPCTAATKEAPCITPPMPTTGLVGFLSNTGDESHWADEYFGVNATVTGGTKVENGFKLSGPGAKVEWEIGNDFPTPLYSFAGRGLTLVATVTIHDIPKSDTPLMRVGLESKAVGLWYGKENHWKGLSDGKENASWEKGKPYQVAITVMNGAGSVYIGGKRLGSLDMNFQPNNDGKAPQPPPEEDEMPHELQEEPRLICFGGCGSVYDGDESTAASSFTVTSVLLYNRVLSEAELLPTPPPQQQSQSTAKETKEATITGKPTAEKRSNKTPTGNDSSLHVRLSGVFLLFALLAFLDSAPL